MEFDFKDLRMLNRDKFRIYIQNDSDSASPLIGVEEGLFGLGFNKRVFLVQHPASEQRR